MSQGRSTRLIHCFLVWQLLVLIHHRSAAVNAAGGSWQLLQKSIGISAMHMQQLHDDSVIIFDRTDFGPSKLPLPAGKCRNDPHDQSLTHDCTAHSAKYNVVSNTFNALEVLTDVWCSSGAAMPDGRLVQSGGFNDGEKKIRVIFPCQTCDWQEISNGLAAPRWYATNQLLPDGRQIIIGGRREFNYEFYPKTPATSGVYNLPFLSQTNDLNQENNLYPFVHLNVDGNLFIFANNRAILFNYKKGVVVKTYPQIPGGDPRNYPSTGSSVLLPLKNLQSGNVQAEVLICGGAPRNSFLRALRGNFLKALNTCGRIKITDPSPRWVMETMPIARTMGDMILLPNGNVLIINGVQNGVAGWELGRNAVLNPVLYKPDNRVGSRFEVQNPSTIARAYHSSAILLRDGRVLVGGSNPHEKYEFRNVIFPTELSLEAFSPDYLSAGVAYIRPRILVPQTQSQIGYGLKLAVRFWLAGPLNANAVSVTLVAPSFSTHSFSQSQRLLVLNGIGKAVPVAKNTYRVEVITPGSGNLAPAAFYMIYVVHQGIPSPGIWVQLK
ncbi:Galactose oxidase-like, Early set domain [Dillenia turbinata]|uniref:Galactose oxidase-like, Early set domain n=1 Tax=Dillenia turbinata TaxID=194707 RepID=A0AAN8VSH5_9MAGN